MPSKLAVREARRRSHERNTPMPERDQPLGRVAKRACAVAVDMRVGKRHFGAPDRHKGKACLGEIFDALIIEPRARDDQSISAAALDETAIDRTLFLGV